MATLRAPVRNKPTTGDRHKCKLTVEIDGKLVDLTNEQVVRSLNLDNGMIFTCEDEVIVAGKKQTCGKEYSLHYPTKFEWKLRRKPADANGEAATEPQAAQASAAKPKGK